MTRTARSVGCALAALFLAAGCTGDARDPPAGATADGAGSQAAGDPAAAAVLARALQRIEQVTDSIDDLLQPVPLLTPAQEAALRRYDNAQQLSRANALGVRPRDSAHIDALVADGRLVALEDTELWVVLDLDHSAPFVTPDTKLLLERVARRFQERITARGLPPYRLEVSSVLRTQEQQAQLRRTNPNAAGASAHELATTIDVLYASFAAPASHGIDLDIADAAWLRPHLERIAAAMLETAAARKSRELQAILGAVLTELQNAGDVMVTLERQQPVYHFTLARPQSR